MKKILSLFALLMLCVTGAKAQDSETIFSADVVAKAAVSFEPGTTEITSDNATITGGKMYAISEQEGAKNLIAKQGSNFLFCMTNNNTYFKLELDKALAVGDVISAMTYSRTDTNLGLFVTTEANRPSECSTKLSIASVSTAAYEAFSDYTVTEGDGLVGATEIYIYRETGKSTYFNEFKISRAAEPTYTNKSIFLDATDWGASDARYAVYAFNSDEDNQWFDFVGTGVENNFTTQVPDNFGYIILVRMNGTTTENIWDNKWNQTDDIDFTAIADGTIFTVSFEGSNSVYTTSNPLAEAKEKLAKAIAMAEMLQSADLAEAIATAKAAQESTDVTEITAAMKTLFDAAKPVATVMVGELMVMANTYGYSDLASQITALAMSLNSQNPDMDAVATQLTNLMAQGKVAAQ